MIMRLTINEYKVVFFIWNLFLLLIPFFLCAYAISFWQKRKFKKIKHQIWAALIGFLWLLFIPNAAYVIADVRHLSGFCQDANPLRNCPDTIWIIMLYYVYASIGWVGFVLLINQMRDFIKRLWGELASRLYQALIIPLIALGVLLGLVQRRNSWDVFSTPLAIFKDLWLYFSTWLHFRNLVLFTLFFYILYFAGNIVFTKKKIKININIRS